MFDSIERQIYFKKSLLNSVYVWTARFSSHLERVSDCLSILSSDEKQRAERYVKMIDQQKAVLGLAWRRSIVARYLQVAPQSLIFSYSKKGKPSVNHLHFSVSHSDDYWAMAVAQELVGIDVEVASRNIAPLEIAQRFFTAAELAQLQTATDPLPVFLQMWTAKEAYLKAVGVGIAHGLDQVEINFDQGAVPCFLQVGAEWQLRVMDLWPAVFDALVSHQGVKHFEKIYF